MEVLAVLAHRLNNNIGTLLLHRNDVDVICLTGEADIILAISLTTFLGEHTFNTLGAALCLDTPWVCIVDCLSVDAHPLTHLL